MLNSKSIPLTQCSLLTWTASQICISAFSYLSLVMMDLLLLKDTNFHQLWDSSQPFDGEKKGGRVEDIKCLRLKIAVRTNLQETHFRAIYRLSVAFLVTEPDCNITPNIWFTMPIFHGREAFFQGYLRKCWCWGALSTLQKHPRSQGFGFVWANRWGSSPNPTTSLYSQPCTSSAPGTHQQAPLHPIPDSTSGWICSSPPKTKLSPLLILTSKHLCSTRHLGIQLFVSHTIWLLKISLSQGQNSMCSGLPRGSCHKILQE